MLRNNVGILGLLILLCTFRLLLADDKTVETEKQKEIVMQTLGGGQFWGDVFYHNDWRIQQNVFTEHYRLLDGRDRRHASGTFQDCHERFLQIKTERNLEPMSGKAVILVHGIIRSSKSFAKLRTALEKEGYRVFGFDYPSTRIPIPDSATYLGRVISSLDGIEEINFVVHSMGGLVVRSWIGTQKEMDPRINRMVMLGVPNLGAGMADRVQKLGLFKFVFGPAGQQLITDSEGIIATLPTPEFEFGILSGARGNPNGFNPLIDGDDDGTVELANTRLPGASDFVTVNALHSFLMNSDESVEMTVRYLNTGAFRESGEKQPIPKTIDEESKSSLNP